MNAPLVLGPVLRHVDEESASIWVQVDRPCTVEVLGCTARTFEVQGHHYALVQVSGLGPGTTTEYQVALDGERAWPPAHHAFPPSVIRTRRPAGHGATIRLVFGSCRYPKTGDPRLDQSLGLDALDSYAARLAGRPVEERPDALVLLGDQVYADELTPDARRRLAGRRRGKLAHGNRPPDEVVSFGEYERLYCSSWSDPEIRWIMSTVPVAMIFDDHDVRDDWNTSASWRAEMARTDWWPERIRAALASYWVYQHLGNLSPAELAANEDYRKLLACDGDTWPLLAEIADRADREVDASKGVQFSYRWDLGGTRLIMIDSRNGRILESGERMMLGEEEFAWITEQMCDDPGELDHLVLGTSLPWLLPHAIGDLQSVNERAADRDGWRGRLAEQVRQAADLEHWPAFMGSFLRLSALIADVATRPDGPASISVLSGDVHHSYAARVTLRDGAGNEPRDPAGRRAVVHQLVCSPVHNYVPAPIRPMFRIGWSRRLAPVARRWAVRHGVPELPVSWRNISGPLFGNTIATLEVRGRSAQAVFEQPSAAAALDEAARVPLTEA